MTRVALGKAAAKAYAYEHLTDHLWSQKRFLELFEVIERQDHLAGQINHTQGLTLASRSLEEHVLPAAREAEDGQRFLRFSLVAINLREISGALAVEGVLESLLRLGQGALARNLLEQLSDPQQRARARAVALGAAGTVEDDEAMARLREDLGQAPSPRTREEADRWLATLLSLTRALPPQALEATWSRWIARLEGVPEEAEGERTADSRVEGLSRLQQAWWAVAESWLSWDGDLEPGFWQALKALGSEKEISRLLPRRIAQRPEAGVFLSESLPPPFEKDEPLLAQVRAALLALDDQSRTDDPAELLGRLQVPAHAWSPALVEAGRELWAPLGRQGLERLAREIPEAEARAALWVVALEEERIVEATDNAGAAVEEISGAEERLHWTLRWLATQPPSPRRRKRLDLAEREIRWRRYQVSMGDLALFFDLTAGAGPEVEIRRRLDAFVFSPASSTEKVKGLVAGARHELVWRAWLEGAEDVAAAVTESETEGFELRYHLIEALVCRFCVLAAEARELELAAERLLPEEEDRLRMAAVNALMTEREGTEEPERRKALLETAGEVAEMIRPPRLRLQAGLRTAVNPSDVKKALPPANVPARLYEGAGAGAAVRDELLALRPLAVEPEVMGPSAREAPMGIFHPDRRVLAFADLARHVLDWEGRTLPPKLQDPVAALRPLFEVVPSLSSEARLLAFVPELVSLGARVGFSRGLAELQEAVLRVLRLESQDLDDRIEVLATLVARAGPLLLGRGGVPASRRCRATARFFRWVAHLPFLRELGEGGLPGVWPRLLPAFLGTVCRLPAECRRYLPFEPQGPMWKQLPAPGPAGKGSHGWATPEQRGVLHAWLDAEPDVLQRRAAEVIGRPGADPLEARTLAFLLSGREPDLVSPLLSLLPEGADRDRWCRWLVEKRWLQGDAAGAAVALCASPAARWESEIWWRFWRGDPAWVKALSELLAQTGADPLEPRILPLRRGLRQGVSTDQLKALGEAVSGAFGRGGGPAAAEALPFWTDAFFGYCKARRAKGFESVIGAAIEDAESLPGAGAAAHGARTGP